MVNLHTSLPISAFRHVMSVGFYTVHAGVCMGVVWVCRCVYGCAGVCRDVQVCMDVQVCVGCAGVCRMCRCV